MRLCFALRSFFFGVLVLSPVFGGAASAREFHVVAAAKEGGSGTKKSPLRSISAAAQLAQPGDTVTVYAGVYRERVTPPRGGVSEGKRITYRAAPNQRVEIKGSERVRDWTLVEKDVWKVVLPNSFFGSYNPYKEVMAGDWFYGPKWPLHTGEVYLNGQSFYEAPSLEKVKQPDALRQDPQGSLYRWFCESDENNTTIYANFQGKDPNRELVEINVRESCFYPAQTGRNYITVRGFTMSQAATPWAAPTAEQIGLIGTNWSKGWIIENNVVNHSKSAGITLGKDRASGQNAWFGSRKSGSVVYNEVILKAIANGWSRANVGSHIVRDNTVFACEQAGICGSMGAAFSQISGNHVYDIHTKRLFSGAEMGGIKIHGAIDVLIQGNRVHNAMRGLWMDWMAQGTRISGNLLYDNSNQDVYMEVNHGPYLLDNNLFLSPTGVWDMSQGGAFAHNLFAGRLIWKADGNRDTPFLKPHSTEIAGVVKVMDADNRFYNNIFVKSVVTKNFFDRLEGLGQAGYGLSAYAGAKTPLQTGGNVYWNGAQPFEGERDAIVRNEFDPQFKLTEQGDAVTLNAQWNQMRPLPAAQVVTTKRLGTTKISQAAFTNPNGSPLRVETDYFGQKRTGKNLQAGPFTRLAADQTPLQVWPMKAKK